MRAVNLIPAGERRNAGGIAGRSGGAVYAVLGGLAVLVMLSVLFALAARSVDHKRDRLATLETQATASEARSSQYQRYTQFATLRASRTQTVSSIAASRFDWSHAMHELARTVPNDVWLTNLLGTVTPGVPVKGGNGLPTSALRSQLPTPAVEMIGCTTDQKAVARMLVRMRLLDAVTRVTLQGSDKAASGGGSAGGAGSDCRYGSTRYPQFSLVVFFDQTTGAVPTGPAAGATGASGATGAVSATSVPTSFQESK